VQPLVEGDIELVLVWMRGSTPAEVSARVGKVSETAINHGAVVHDLVGSLVIIAFGSLPIKQETPQARLALIKALRQEWVEDMKILHGAVRGFFGLIGGQPRQSHSFIVPKFDVMLSILLQMNYGQVEEFTA
jgi:hypothetical protein